MYNFHNFTNIIEQILFIMHTCSMFQVCIRATMYRAHSHWSGEVFQLKAIPLVKPKSMDGIFVILFNNIVQNVENFRATLVIFYKIYRTNFWLALEQTAGGVIWIISHRRLLRATSKRISYMTVMFSFGIRRQSVVWQKEARMANKNKTQRSMFSN